MVGDYKIPNITLPTEATKPLGAWGLKRKDYLMKHKRVQFNIMLMNGTLWSNLAEVDEQAYVRTDAIEQIVLLELRKLISFMEYDEEAFAEILSNKTNADILAQKNHLQAELKKTIERIETVERLYLKLYEDNSSGKVTDEWFMCMSHKYEVERVELKAKIPELRTQIGSLKKRKKAKKSL